jgi:hypothetical protein
LVLVKTIPISIEVNHQVLNWKERSLNPIVLSEEFEVYFKCDFRHPK